MSAPAPFRCTDAARERADPQLGTAPQARRWLLLEHRGPWQVDALASAGIPSVLARVADSIADGTVRPLLIRRPGRPDPGAPRSWAVTYDEGLTRWGSLDADDGPARAAEALAAPGPGPDAVDDPVLLVCAHGLHDVCCAVRGRPVAAALAAEWPAETWECSHVGGDRFAANVVLLPDGVYYGNLDPASAVDTVQSHLRGEVRVEHLRGMTRVPPPAQVAVAAVHERFGPFGARDVVLVGLEHRSGGRWLLELAAPRPGLDRVLVTVSSTRRPPERLTCRAGAATPATDYAVLDLTVG